MSQQLCDNFSAGVLIQDSFCSLSEFCSLVFACFPAICRCIGGSFSSEVRNREFDVKVWF